MTAQTKKSVALKAHNQAFSNCDALRHELSWTHYRNRYRGMYLWEQFVTFRQ